MREFRQTQGRGTMQIPATTHGTVDQAGSIYGPEKKVEGFAKVETRSTSPNLMAVSVRWNTALLLGRYGRGTVEVRSRQ
jgi:hypothetical protein